MTNLSFYQNKRVFVTGHTGFVGSWLCHVLLREGAQVYGYALSPQESPNLFSICRLSERVESVIADICDFETLHTAIDRAKPDVVIHLAAQPLVREGYLNPRITYETNVMGTVNLLEAIRILNLPTKSLLNVTTDKVYQNKETAVGFMEENPLDGRDPYSNSKSCSELVTHSYKSSFFDQRCIAVSTARAGNIIGGGDFGKDRIIPDCFRAAQQGIPILVRNPDSIRPYQHVLESVFAYLLIAQKQYEDPKLAGAYNIGPNEEDCCNTKELVELFCNDWGNGLAWINQAEVASPHEVQYLKLNCSKMKNVFGWGPRWDAKDAIEKTIEWSKAFLADGEMLAIMDQQIDEYQDIRRKSHV